MSKLVNPKLLDEKNVAKLLKAIGRKEIFDSNALTDVQKYDICKLVRPDLAKKFETQRRTRNTLDKDGLCYALPEIVAQIFLMSIWWEAGESIGSFEYEQELAPQMKHVKAFKKRIHNSIEEMKKIESEANKIKEGKGFRDKDEVNDEIARLKDKHGQALYASDTKHRKEYLRIREIADGFKQDRNHLETELENRIRELDTLRQEWGQFRSENMDLKGEIRQLKAQISNPPQ